MGDVIVGGVAPSAGRHDLGNKPLDRPRSDPAQLRPERAARRRLRHVNLLVPPKHPDADAASSSWSRKIRRPCSAPTRSASPPLLDSGILPMKEPVTEITLEAPGGLVRVRAECPVTAGRTHLRREPAELCERWTRSWRSRARTLTVDTAYGGDSFVIVDAAAMASP